MTQDLAKSDALEMRVVNLGTKFADANITGGDMKAFRKVATAMADYQGLIDGDDLIAASFLNDV
ncbi:hypothetical protein GCM10007881_40500 [Mesorhizobium huakuii]|uniref:hypothetical protein n=1 Tax=Mesorhizobium huakuii TaxID=28104 RepID=UPI00235CE70E|nr:hypothetical protein [Mesorhizobium huakuii]GLQ80531.1 hypothetical protein GCM10007881_40500 [Mesorhizobium huakuii]